MEFIKKLRPFDYAIIAIVFICFDKEYIPNTIKSQIPKKWFEKIKQIIRR